MRVALRPRWRQIVAVRPRSGLVPYFQAAAKYHESQSGFSDAQSGSDGTRTRDLRRDRSGHTSRA
jgi:hypothetical protein